MDLSFQKRLLEAIEDLGDSGAVIEDVKIDEEDPENGYVRYNPNGVFIDSDTVGFSGYETQISDEEIVRAHLVSKLVSNYNYPASPDIIELEASYDPVGRPTGKGGRIDILVKGKDNSDKPFLFIECKSPYKYDDDMDLIDGQLFRLSRQETEQPRYLVYHTTEYKDSSLRDRTLLIDTDQYSTYDEWDNAGQPSIEAIPYRYGIARKKRYANVEEEHDNLRPLDESVGPARFNRIREEIHNVVWGGGSTNNNDVFINIVKLILCKVYDEKETMPGEIYEFQRMGESDDPESPSELVKRMNDLYEEAEDNYLALPEPTSGPAFDSARISDEKIAFVVGRFESISVTNNKYDGDILGDFFEAIISQNFTQDKTQFFTHVNLVRFMIMLAGTESKVKNTLRNERDQQGQPRLPHTIDPACGSGTFLIEYMKYVTRKVGDDEFGDNLPQSIREYHHDWFRGLNRNNWAKNFVFGIESNYDLGLSTKVNMVLHGDGSTNTWIKSGLLPFDDYWEEGRNNVLGVSKSDDNHPYDGELNEQFDFIFTNPPFSVDLPEDEKSEIEDIFQFDVSTRSETLFIERWYQLLREGGHFCAVLPEAVLDTSSYGRTRVFLLKHFKLEAIVSLPYLAFEPYTSTKTCIVYATKRDKEEVRKIRDKWNEVETTSSRIADSKDATQVFNELGMADEKIFMAEPDNIGYKRRKGLPDLDRPNELFPEPDPENSESEEDNSSDEHEIDDPEESVSDSWAGELNRSSPNTVLEQLKAGEKRSEPDSRLGFWTTLENVVSRDDLRMDPKYRWLWDQRDGVVFGNPDNATQLSEIVSLADMDKVDKGLLNEPRILIDLESVEARQGFIKHENVKKVGKIGSKRVIFGDCDLLFSKLEPYLGKVITDWPKGAIGSPEWVGLNIKDDKYTSTFLSYLLMLPETCEAYRRLKSGKRHARLDKNELLELKFELPIKEKLKHISIFVNMTRNKIKKLRKEEAEKRQGIDRNINEMSGGENRLDISGKIDPADR